MKISTIKAIMIGIPFLTIALTGCANDANKGEAIVLTQTSFNMMEGDTDVVYALTEDTGKVSWNSSDNNIVSVNDGELLGKQAGTAIITATIGKSSAECKVVVSGNQNEGSYLKAKSAGYYLEKNNKKGIKTEFVLCKTDSEGNIKEEKPVDLKYEIYNKKIAKVDENGTITPLEVGPTTMTVSSGELTCSVDVVVSTKLINNEKDWMEVLGTTNNLSDYYYVTKNIDFSGTSYSGLTKTASAEAEKCFRGTIDGGNHVISNIKTSDSGIFGALLDAKIKNLSFKNVTVGSGNSIALSMGGHGLELENIYFELNCKNQGKNILANTITDCGSISKCLIVLESAGSGMKLTSNVPEGFTTSNVAVVTEGKTVSNISDGILVFENQMDAIWKINSTKMLGSDWSYSLNNLPVLTTK